MRTHWVQQLPLLLFKRGIIEILFDELGGGTCTLDVNDGLRHGIRVKSHGSAQTKSQRPDNFESRIGGGVPWLGGPSSLSVRLGGS